MSHALVAPVLVAHSTPERWLRALGAWTVGVLSLGALAQISIALPGTPVPITGQTFGVTLIALVSGRRLGSAIVAGYLAAGLLGLPIFSRGTAFLTGASSGYLPGMLMASLLVGYAADRGVTRKWFSSFAAASLGSILTFAGGLLVLRAYVPREALLAAGLYPFVFGELLKNLTAATLARAVTTTTQRSN